MSSESPPEGHKEVDEAGKDLTGVKVNSARKSRLLHARFDNNEVPGNDEGDFGQSEIQKEKEIEEEMRRKTKTWITGKGTKSSTDAATASRDISQKDVAGANAQSNTQSPTHFISDSPAVSPSHSLTEFEASGIRTPNCTLPNVLHVQNSYGYDSKRPYNIHALDSDTLVYITGNYLHFFSLEKRQIVKLQRAANGYGIGHLAVHPTEKYLAVAEKGSNPLIMVYTWPEGNVSRVLREGTERGYAFVDFNPEGDLLCSQGLEPDYLLTIWDWRKERIVLHYKAFSQDVFRASFSGTHPGHLTTCGIGHIRFWKMARTFTGLKLQGQIGRFGKTEISDVHGFVGLQDGKIISTSEWGNMLVWEGGLIVVEVVPKELETCHEGEMSNILLLETGEILTVGTDGYLRLWESELISVADTVVDDSGKYAMAPILEFKLSTYISPVSVIKSAGDDEGSYFIQDGFGKLWNFKLGEASRSNEYQPEIIFDRIGGSISAIATSTKYTLLAIGNTEGHLWLVEYTSKEPLVKLKYNVGITKLLWIPKKYDSLGLTFLCSFDDGVIRLYRLHQSSKTGSDNSEAEAGQEAPFQLGVLQIFKLHQGTVHVMVLDEDHGILYTCGADRVIFTLKVGTSGDNVDLTPLGFVTAPFAVVSLDLHPFKDYRMVIASRQGRVAECRRPDWENHDRTKTYDMGKLHGRKWQYMSVKSNKRREERRESRVRELESELEELRERLAEKRSGGAFVDEEMEVSRLKEKYRKQQHEDDEAPLYFPESPCPIYSIYYRISKSFQDPKHSRNFFLHVGGYDAGYIYECKCTRAEAGGFHAVPATPPFTDDVAIRCFTHSEENEFLIFGMADGTLRVMSRAQEPQGPESVDARAAEAKMSLLYGDAGDEEEDDDFDDTNILLLNNQANQPETLQKRTVHQPFPVSVFPYNLKEFVAIPIHDPNRGAVTDLAWSHDRKLLFSCAEDGSVFSCWWDPTGGNKSLEDTRTMPGRDILLLEILLEPENLETLTLEEQVQKAENDKIFAASEKKKEGTRKRIETLKSTFRYLKQKNLEISKDFRLPRSAFEIDPAIRAPKRNRLAAEVEQVYRRYEWDSEKSLLEVDRLEKVYLSEVETHHMIVKDLVHNAQVHTFRSRILTPDFLKVMEENAEKLNTESIQQQDEMQVVKEPTFAKAVNVRRIYAKDLIGDYEGKKYDLKTMQQIRLLEQRLAKRYEREVKWAQLMAMKIPNSFLYPADVANVKLAEQTLGAYKLKSDESNLGSRLSIAQRRQQIINLKLEIHNRVSEFNNSVVYLRDEKLNLLQECRDLERQLLLIQRLLPSELHKPVPKVEELEPCEKPEDFFRISVTGVSSRVIAKISVLQASEKGTEEQKKYSIPQVWKNFRQGTSLSANLKTVTELKKESLATMKARKAFFKPTSELGRAKLEKALRERCFEQDELLWKLNNLIDYFGSRVEGLRYQRFELQIDVLLMSMRLITLMHELDIVKEFTGEEEAVVSRYENQKKNTDMVKQRLDRVERRLSKAKNELELVKNNLVSLNKEVATIIGEKQRFSEFLWKVFRKKLKVENADEDEDEEMVQAGSVASSSDSGDSTSIDSTSDLFRLPKAKFNIDSCPPQLDRQVYERVCELRTKKYQYELEAEAQKKVVAKIERDHEGVQEVFEKYNVKLGWIMEELVVLQKKRQAKINRLHALIILKADQVRCMPEDDEEEQESLSRLSSGLTADIVEQIRNNFPDLSDVIVFPKNGLMNLESRIDGVKDETLKEQEKFELGKTMLSRLREEVAKMLNEISSLDEKYQKEMLGKFGQMVDLDDICAAVINLEILDELIKLDSRRNWHHRERRKIATEIDKARDRLTVLTKENTENNNLLAILIGRQRELEYLMWKRAANKWPEWTQSMAIAGSGDGVELNKEFMDHESDLISNEDALEELLHLEDIVTRQECRIFILKQTIEACRRKCGLPPLIPLKSVKDDIASKFMTLNEVYALRNKKNADVETLYVSETADKLHLSTSSVPTGGGSGGLVAGDNEKPAWGIPEHGTFDASGLYYGQGALDIMEDDDEEEVKIIIDEADDARSQARPPSEASLEDEANALEEPEESTGFVGIGGVEIVETTAEELDE